MLWKEKYDIEMRWKISWMREIKLDGIIKLGNTRISQKVLNKSKKLRALSVLKPYMHNSLESNWFYTFGH